VVYRPAGWVLRIPETPRLSVAPAENFISAYTPTTTAMNQTGNGKSQQNTIIKVRELRPSTIKQKPVGVLNQVLQSMYSTSL